MDVARIYFTRVSTGKSSEPPQVNPDFNELYFPGEQIAHYTFISDEKNAAVATDHPHWISHDRRKGYISSGDISVFLDPGLNLFMDHNDTSVQRGPICLTRKNNGVLPMEQQRLRVLEALAISLNPREQYTAEEANPPFSEAPQVIAVYTASVDRLVCMLGSYRQKMLQHEEEYRCAEVSDPRKLVDIKRPTLYEHLRDTINPEAWIR